MGGTTAKCSFYSGGSLAHVLEYEVGRKELFKPGSGYPIQVPVVDVEEIGAGGGSIATITNLGLVRVGPQSAGSDPGPACYGRGGTQPTVSDANLYLGYLSPDRFFGGRMPLRYDLAEAALETTLAQPLGVSCTEAAWTVYELVCDEMASFIKLKAHHQGLKVSDYTLVAYGGAGPLHACRVATKAGISEVVIPLGAGVASSFGMLTAPLSFELVQSEMELLEHLDTSRMRSGLKDLRTKGIQMMAEAGLADDQIQVQFSCHLCYQGQRHKVTVDLPEASLTGLTQEWMKEHFSAEYKRLYGTTNRNTAVQVLQFRVVVTGPRPDIYLRPPAPTDKPSLVETRQVYFPTVGKVSCPVYNREFMPVRFEFTGPAVIEEEYATTVVSPGAKVQVDATGNIRIRLGVE
jgi:N-methylhydantoinase A